MNSSRSPANMTAIMLGGITIGGLLLAIILGQRVASNDFKSIGLLAGAAIAITIVLSAGDKYWLLIPALTAFSGGIRLLPIPFSYSELAAIATIGMYFLYLAFKRARFGIDVKTVDLIVYANLAFLAIVYVRNPAGFLFIRTEMIGGRPYFIILIAFLAYVVLANQTANARLGRAMVYIMAVPAIMIGCVNATVSIFPETTRYIYPFYAGIDISGLQENTDVEADNRRLTGLADVANPTIRLLAALYPATTLVLPSHPGRFLLFFGSLIMVGLSGFRNYYVMAIANLTIASALRKRWADIFIIGVAGVVALSFVIVAQGSGMQMPFAVQRALTMIPFVEWDPAAKADAEQSTQWRLDMWKDVWESPDIIRNRLLGDGFGFRLEDMPALQDSLLNQGMGFDGKAIHEAHIVMGSYHSGPLNTIKRVGYVGLGLLILWYFFQTREILRLLKRSWRTPFQNWALYLAIPAIYGPFSYFFIYGMYDATVPILIYSLGFYKLLDNSLRQYERQLAAPVASAEVLMPMARKA